MKCVLTTKISSQIHRLQDHQDITLRISSLGRPVQTAPKPTHPLRTLSQERCPRASQDHWRRIPSLAPDETLNRYSIANNPLKLDSLDVGSLQRRSLEGLPPNGMNRSAISAELPAKSKGQDLRSSSSAEFQGSDRLYQNRWGHVQRF